MRSVVAGYWTLQHFVRPLRCVGPLAVSDMPAPSPTPSSLPSALLTPPHAAQVRSGRVHRAILREGHSVHQQPLEHQPQKLFWPVPGRTGDVHFCSCVRQHSPLCRAASVRAVTKSLGMCITKAGARVPVLSGGYAAQMLVETTTGTERSGKLKADTSFVLPSGGSNDRHAGHDTGLGSDAGVQRSQ